MEGPKKAATKSTISARSGRSLTATLSIGLDKPLTRRIVADAADQHLSDSAVLDG